MIELLIATLLQDFSVVMLVASIVLAGVISWLRRGQPKHRFANSY